MSESIWILQIDGTDPVPCRDSGTAIRFMEEQYVEDWDHYVTDIGGDVIRFVYGNVVAATAYKAEIEE